MISRSCISRPCLLVIALALLATAASASRDYEFKAGDRVWVHDYEMHEDEVHPHYVERWCPATIKEQYQLFYEKKDNIVRYEVICDHTPDPIIGEIKYKSRAEIQPLPKVGDRVEVREIAKDGITRWWPATITVVGPRWWPQGYEVEFDDTLERKNYIARDVQPLPEEDDLREWHLVEPKLYEGPLGQRLGIKFNHYDNGMQIVGIDEDQPGLQLGDLIISINDESLLCKEDQQKELLRLHIKDGVQLTVKRWQFLNAKPRIISVPSTGESSSDDDDHEPEMKHEEYELLRKLATEKRHPKKQSRGGKTVKSAAERAAAETRSEFRRECRW